MVTTGTRGARTTSVERSPDRVERLWRNALADPERVVFTAGALDEAGRPERRLTFGELARRTRSVAARLAREGVGAGDRVAVMLPNGLDYVVAVFGAMAAGAIAVPLFPPGSPKHRERLESIVLETRPAALIVPEDAVEGAAAMAPVRHAGCRILVAEALAAEDLSRDFSPVPVHEIAFLQYTSGSTSRPKGVMVTHANVNANGAAIETTFGAGRSARGVCWLPLFHDMGMIGSILHPAGRGCRCHLMDPSEFLASPAGWLRTVSALGADIAGGPNFGFDWCTDHVRDEQMEGVDLSGWRVAYNGAEPISAATLDRFAARFARWGFERDAFLCCYGLAEFTVLVSGASLGAPGMVRRVDAAALADGRVRPVAEGGHELVASGSPTPGTELRVVGRDGAQLGEGQSGEILVAGPDRAKGYWKQGAATRETFGTAPDDPHPGFLRTGDVGSVLEGRLFVTGRRKELIVVRGRNLYPHDVEAVSLDALGRPRGLSCAAFAMADEAGEALALACEVPPGAKETLAELALAVRLAVAESSGVQPRLVALVRRRSLPKTSSGKLRRLEVAERHRRGTLPTLHVDELRDAGATRARPALATPYRAPSGAYELAVANVWSAVLGVADPGADDGYLDLGGDSVGAAQIAARLGALFGVTVELSELFEARTIAEVAELVERATRGETSAADDLVEIEL